MQTEIPVLAKTIFVNWFLQGKSLPKELETDALSTWITSKDISFLLVALMGRRRDMIDSKRQGFVMLYDFYNQIFLLSDEDAGILLKSIFCYEREGVLPEPQNTSVNLVFHGMKRFLDESRENYNATCKRNQKNAQKRWDKIMPSDTVASDGTKSHSMVSDGTESHTKNAKYKNKHKHKHKHNPSFVPPTLQQVQDYAIERGRSDLANIFYDFYEAGNWTTTGGKKICSWKQQFITWEKRTPAPAEDETQKAWHLAEQEVD